MCGKNLKTEKNSGNVFDKVSGDYFCKSTGEISEISQNCKNVGYIIPDISLASTYDIFFWHLMFSAGCLLFLEGFEILFFHYVFQTGRLRRPSKLSAS